MGYGESRFQTYPLGGLVENRRVTAVVGVLSLAVFMSSLDLFIVNLAFPYISRDYPGTSLSSLSWVLNAYTIVFAAVLGAGGRAQAGTPTCAEAVDHAIAVSSSDPRTG